jgi:dienelactone hydrolase
MGWSHGGATALTAIGKGLVAQAQLPGGGFRAAVALYPPCGIGRLRVPAAPLLILLGGVDNWASPQRCEELGARLTPMPATP